MHNINLSIFYFINNAAGYYRDLDVFMLFLTTYLAYGIPIIVGLYVCFFIPMHTTAPISRLKSLAQGGELIIATFLTWFVTQAIKVYVAYPRPFVTLHDIVTLAPNQSGYSFPSGHASLTFAVATTVYLYHKRLGTLLYAFALVVGMSRIYIGVHYPIDVFVGALLGIGIGLLVHKVFSPFCKSSV